MCAKPAQPSQQSEKVLEFLRTRAASETAVQRILLFGSRARGDFGERSDYDIAVDAPAMSETQWSRWALSLREDIPTLCGLDLVLLSPHLSKDLASKIAEEGIEIYVRK